MRHSLLAVLLLIAFGEDGLASQCSKLNTRSSPSLLLQCVQQLEERITRIEAGLPSGTQSRLGQGVKVLASGFRDGLTQGEVKIDQKGLLFFSSSVRAKRESESSGSDNVSITLAVNDKNCSLDGDGEAQSKEVTFRASAACVMQLDPGLHTLKANVVTRSRETRVVEQITHYVIIAAEEQ